MTARAVFQKVRYSLASLLGAEYVEAVAAARARIAGEDERKLRRLAAAEVDFFPESFQRRLVHLLPAIGQRFSVALRNSPHGASTRAFNAATHPEMAPLCGFGYYRVCEDGRLCCITKSEHYHAPLGHAFPGYHLIEQARRLGIPNATHNNTRGYITRLLEEELVRTANAIEPGDKTALARAIRSKSATPLNCVLNLETGSLATEAALKMMLARFYRVQPEYPPPKYAGRVPVLLVLGDDDGALGGNYHGTTVVTQIMRGMWAELRAACDQRGIVKVVPVRPNNLDDARAAFARYDTGRYKIAGFCHELIMMNYGARLLEPPFIRRLYQLCRAHDVPTLADEIQSCLWSPGFFFFREYGLRPTFVALGKGFPGGEYPASRLLFNADLDCLPQFGALVTNGQEELASLAYLITMRWAEANRTMTRAVGEHYGQRLSALADRYPQFLRSIGGTRHLSSLCFHDLPTARAFAAGLTEKGFDISVQIYKSNCAPVALTKLPLIAGYELVDRFAGAIGDTLKSLARAR